MRKYKHDNPGKEGLAGKIGQRLTELNGELQDKMSPMICEHRLETVKIINGIRFVNDSWSTNVNRLWFSLEELSGPIVLIMGGVDKGNNYEPVIELVKEKVTEIVMLGESEYRKISRAFGSDKIVIVESMEDAIAVSKALAKPGSTVLLSPACASFDMFENYEDRGQQFKNAVNRI